jgi:hypothetical protein
LSLSQEKYVWQHPVTLYTANYVGRNTCKLRRSLVLDCTSKTPYECWRLATQAAEEAKAYQQAIASIADKADRTELNARVSALNSTVRSELEDQLDVC